MEEKESRAGRSPRALTQRGVHERILEIFERLPRGTVLDAPAGEGALSAALRDFGFHVTACDIAEGFLPEGIPFRRLDLDDLLPFPDGTFDCVACVEGIEHVENPYRLVRDFARVLRPGGALVLSTPNVLGIRSRIRFFFGSHHRRFKGIEPGGHLTPLSYRELAYAFERAGLAIEAIATNRYRPVWGPLYPLLRALIRWRTRAHHPLAGTISRREILDGSILILVGRKKGDGSRGLGSGGRGGVS
ncbi:MAG: class I SAM-dependent methyltransferase [Planctomycetes bacterium]|nr:class I SAM-dependent methyltransferase [Planctomycetota bacterium]